MEKRDYYHILGIDRSASKDQVKASYRKMAMKYHPDRNPGNKDAETKFKEATQAYEILSNAEKRKQYDQFGHAGVEGGAGGAGGAHNMNMDDIFSNFGDIFGDIFGEKGRQSRTKQGPEAKRGHDLLKEVSLSLKDAFLGKKQELGYYRFFPCTTCDSKGTQKGTRSTQCVACKGVGQTNYRQGFFMYSQPCNGCSGQGYKISSPCSDCSGQSRSQKYDSFTVTIPQGVFDGAELRISSKGDAGVYGGRSGDLLIKIHVAADKKFQRDGDDLVCNIMLTYPQLVLGGQVEIESIDGSKETIKIPRGCPVGKKILVPGKGFTKVRTQNVRGNLVVITKCHIPLKLSSNAKKSLKDYSDIIGTQTDAYENSLTGFFKKFLG